jgi:hypothetical protein
MSIFCIAILSTVFISVFSFGLILFLINRGYADNENSKEWKFKK